MQPKVSAICPYADRPQFVKQMLQSFRAQSYKQKELIIYDNGDVPVRPELQRGERYIREPRDGRTIGELRNAAIMHADADLILHFDVDDWSHPKRIVEQVDFLQASGADVVGYNQVLFWRDDVPCNVRRDVEAMVKDFPKDAFPLPEHLRLRPAEAWLYTSGRQMRPVGASLCYRTSSWMKRGFADAPKNGAATGEDYLFLLGRVVQSVGVGWLEDPRMICRIHGSNTATYDIERQMAAGATQWDRVPQCDELVRGILG